MPGRVSNRINDFLADTPEVRFEDIAGEIPELRLWGQ